MLFIASSAHQRGNVGGCRLRQPFEIVAAFQHRNDAAFGGLVGDLHQFLRGPGEIRLVELQIGERVAPMGVEPGRDDDQLGGEVAQPRQDTALERLAELVAAIAGAQRGVDDGVVLAASDTAPVPG